MMNVHAPVKACRACIFRHYSSSSGSSDDEICLRSDCRTSLSVSVFMLRYTEAEWPGINFHLTSAVPTLCPPVQH